MRRKSSALATTHFETQYLTVRSLPPRRLHKGLRFTKHWNVLLETKRPLAGHAEGVGEGSWVTPRRKTTPLESQIYHRESGFGGMVVLREEVVWGEADPHH